MLRNSSGWVIRWWLQYLVGVRILHWTHHLRVRRNRSSGRHVRLRESLREDEGILLRHNEHMDASATWANERWHDLEMGTLFAFDENWDNRTWDDLELVTTIDSNDMGYNNLQTVQTLPRDGKSCLNVACTL